MPVKKNKKKIKKQLKKTVVKKTNPPTLPPPLKLWRPRKLRRVKNKKRIKKRKIQLPDKIEDLAQQLPEDRYTEALQQKEELEKIRPTTIPVKKAKENKKKEYRGSKTFMWFMVIGVFLIILILWLFSLQFTLSDNGAETKNWTGFKSNFTYSFKDFKTEIEKFRNSIQKIETAANTNSNGSTIKKNINALTDDQIKAMEEKVFPKLKNNN